MPAAAASTQSEKPISCIGPFRQSLLCRSALATPSRLVEVRSFHRSARPCSETTKEAQTADSKSVFEASDTHPLDCFFRPRGVALIGATDKVGSVGKTVLQNLIASPFGGTVYPINPTRANVLGVKAYTKVSAVPDVVDLAVVCIPAARVPEVVEDCGKKGVKGIIIISAGFQEEQVGDEGKELLRKCLESAKKYGIRIIGPNCLGVSSSVTGLNATFGPVNSTVKRGSVALVSQSGALICSAIDWALQENFGFSHIVSIGSMSDVQWGDLIEYLGKEPRCSAIVMYMESIGNARDFLSAARRVARTKPIIVIKAGRTEAGAKAAASHTGTMTGGDRVLDTAFLRAGVLRVTSAQDIFYLADILSNQPLPKGNRLTIITNAGGPGILAADALSVGGGQLAELAQSTHDELNKFLPSVWSHSNPVDIIGDASAEQYAKTTAAIAKDPNTDGIVVILTPQAMTESTETAARIVELLKDRSKPVIGAWMGGAEVLPGIDILKKHKIPAFAYSDLAASIFNYLWQYSANLQRLYEIPDASTGALVSTANRQEAERIVQTARNKGDQFLSETDSKKILDLYGIPVTPMVIADTADVAAAAAEKMGFPVVVKLNSSTITHKADVGGVHLNLKDKESVKAAFNSMKSNPLIPSKDFQGASVQPMLKLDNVVKLNSSTITHKADVGGVHLNLKDKESVKAAFNSMKSNPLIPSKDFQGASVQPMLKLDNGYEIIIGMNLDGQLGPVLLFGTGGSLVEVYKDSALGLPPLNSVLASQMIHSTKIAEVFKGVRGRQPIDIHEVERIMVKFSQLVIEQPFIKEIDINPLFVSSDKILALDARIVLHSKDTPLSAIPRPALRPYPHEYTKTFTTATGAEIVIRPTRPEDEPLLDSFVRSEYESSAGAKETFAKYFSSSEQQQILTGRLINLCAGDYVKEFSLIAVRQGAKGAEVYGLARVAKLPDNESAQFSAYVGDRHLNEGLGAEFVNCAAAIVKAEGLKKLVSFIEPSNKPALSLAEKLYSKVEPSKDGKMVKAYKVVA
eukprot:CAMPEP_0184674580 /NCGR_PEP_ID=MMETSP0308-20130426/87314_1 /TAXON_ID=38269 /ORGANISM="Gloeochaete witrockiana, Strain SAG 46.84" /LENGTH=1029 /DNA_ID=CAMNT_0027122201 /DNA_START=213 /DNA_END=3302 /DNA_ORIENTATION=+